MRPSTQLSARLVCLSLLFSATCLACSQLPADASPQQPKNPPPPNKAAEEKKRAEAAAKQKAANDAAAKRLLEQQKKEIEHQKQMAEKAKHEGLKNLRIEEARILKSVSIVLASTNHDYHGHREKAMKMVERLSNQVDAILDQYKDAETKEKVAEDRFAVLFAKDKAKTDASVHEFQAYSDFRMLHAASKLRGLAAAASAAAANKQLAAPVTAQQADIATKANHAINEINLALRSVHGEEIRGRELRILSEVSIYLQASSKAYGGHRGKSLVEVVAAMDLLEKRVLKDKQLIVDDAIELRLSDDAIKSRVSGLTNVTAQLTTSQTKADAIQLESSMSDMLITQASVMLEEVTRSLAKNEPAGSEILKRAQAALGEVQAATKMIK